MLQAKFSIRVVFRVRREEASLGFRARRNDQDPALPKKRRAWHPKFRIKGSVTRPCYSFTEDSQSKVEPHVRLAVPERMWNIWRNEAVLEDYSLLQKRYESRNDVLDNRRELMDRFEQRLTLDNPRLAQGHFESKLLLRVRVFINGADEEYEACF